MITLKLEGYESKIYIAKNEVCISLNSRIYFQKPEKFNPLNEFRNYCTKFKIWVENNYDTINYCAFHEFGESFSSNLLHCSIVFQILESFEKLNIENLKGLFKIELMKQIESGNSDALFYLIDKYLCYIKKEDSEILSCLFDENTCSIIKELFFEKDTINLTLSDPKYISHGGPEHWDIRIDRNRNIIGLNNINDIPIKLFEIHPLKILYIRPNKFKRSINRLKSFEQEFKCSIRLLEG